MWNRQILKKCHQNSEDYLDFYKKWMKHRVSVNPKAAVVDIYSWEENGNRQITFLRDWGLRPYHKLLDLGCGTLSLGRTAIPYLDKFNYIGMDISDQTIAEGIKLVGENIIEEKKPLWIINTDLSFDSLISQNVKVDFIIAFSVFNHLPIGYFEEFCQNVTKILLKDSVIFLTVRLGQQYGGINIQPYTSFNYTTDLLDYTTSKYKLKWSKILTQQHWEGDLLSGLKMIKIIQGE